MGNIFVYISMNKEGEATSGDRFEESSHRDSKSYYVTPAEPVITEYFCFCREKRKWCPKSD